MGQPAAGGNWPVGAFDFGNQLRKGRKFEDLSLTPGERKALEDIQRLYSHYTSQEMHTTGRHSGMNMTKEIMLAQLRGMKIIFDRMMQTEDATRESMAWQSRLY